MTEVQKVFDTNGISSESFQHIWSNWYADHIYGNLGSTYL
jgi:hypothetical protein